MRSKILKDKISALNKAKNEGREEEKREIARKLIDVLDDETISKKVGISIEEVKDLRKSM